MKKKIGIIGQFPPPIHGLSKALEVLIQSELKNKYELKKYDITNNKKFLYQICRIIFSDLDGYYLTISQSKFGNLRDIILIGIIKLKRKKLIIHLHGGGFRNILDDEFSLIQKKVNYKLLKDVEVAIVLGESLRYIFEDIVDEKKIRIVENFIDNRVLLSDEKIEKKINGFMKKQEFQILYLSNLIKEKGYKEVLELASYVRKKKDNRFKFVFAGAFFSEYEKQEFYSFIEENDLCDIVRYEGVVSGQKKLDLIQNSDYFMLLTRYKNEGQPISIIEAASNCLRIITTNHAGIKDILSDSEMIMLDKEKLDIKNIYTLLDKEFRNRNDFSDILIKNRKKVLQKFSEERYIKNIDYIFNEL